jgi:eukaryotic-like serine/threonine-protein kinase
VTNSTLNADPQNPTLPGSVLAGKYRVEKIIGQGGMGVVVEARHIALDERVALKFLLAEYAHHPEAAARFLREARAAVKIKSEHVARVSDVGTLDSGAPYMVMEYLDGPTFRRCWRPAVICPSTTRSIS